MKRAALVLAASLLVGCTGSVTVPDATLAKLAATNEAMLRRLETILLGQAQLDGKMQTLIGLKKEEVEALHEVRDGLRSNESLFERLLSAQLGGGQRQ